MTQAKQFIGNWTITTSLVYARYLCKDSLKMSVDLPNYCKWITTNTLPAEHFGGAIFVLLSHFGPKFRTLS